MVGLAGTIVSVTTRTQTGTDAYNAPIYETVTEAITDVLPQPGATDDLDADRPDGIRIDMTFHWPRTDHRDLRGAVITYDGRQYKVVGDPRPYLDANCPGRWDRAVGTELIDG